MRTLDLFSGIGAFSLGLERAGFETVAFCEIEEFPRRVLRRHWPTVPIYDDVRTLTAARLAADGIGRIDAICGGFPCQDISLAGSGDGLDGERSGLWREFARLIREIRPRVVIVENTSALLGRGLGDVVGDMAEVGYDVLWNCIPAAAVGAPHQRDRVWIIAVYSDGHDGGSGRTRGSAAATSRESVAVGAFQDADSPDANAGHEHPQQTLRAGRDAADPGAADAAHADSQRRAQCLRLQRSIARALAESSAPWEWTREPAFCRVDDGPTKRVERARLKALGNSVVPAIPELLGRAVLEEVCA